MMITSAKGNTAADPIRLNSWISDVNVNYPKVSKVIFKLFFLHFN